MPNAEEKLLSVLQSLCRHVEALQRDVKTLAARITPYDDEAKRPPEPAWSGRIENLKPEQLTPTALALIVRQADRQLQNLEADFRYLRSRIDEVGGDCYLRADLKRWLVNANRR